MNHFIHYAEGLMTNLSSVKKKKKNSNRRSRGADLMMSAVQSGKIKDSLNSLK